MLTIQEALRGRILRFLLIGGFFSFLVLLAPLFFVRLQYRGRILPGVSVSGISLGGRFSQGALAFLGYQTDGFLAKPLLFNFEDEKWEFVPKDIGLSYSLSLMVERAYAVGRLDTFFHAASIFQTLTGGVDLPLEYSYDAQALEATISAIQASIDIPSIPPSIQVLDPDPQSGSRIAVFPGEAGRRMDVSSFRRELHQRFMALSSAPVLIDKQDLPSSDLPVDTRLTQLRAQRLLDKKISLSYEDSNLPSTSWEVDGTDLVHFLSFDGGFDRERIASYSATLAQSIDRPPQNASFIFRGGRVVEFAAERMGLALRAHESVDLLVDALSQLEISEQQEVSLTLPIQTTEPAITASDVNDLGIKELLGRGSSTFHGSIVNREHNIALSSSRVAGVLVPPGEVFSFNDSVGDISAATGYRQAYIIKSGRTVLDDGGGVCQVSTTLFRAALDAGLPIVERTAHSYRVSYYEQNSKAGFDATVFAPRVDLKFLNDTPGNLLIQATADTKANSLVFEIYGTSDGRVAVTSNHRLWDVTPPPPDIYQDDSTLPAGVVKQVDWKAWGAKVKFDYSVTRGEETIYEKTFYSSFRPWQSVFLRGTDGI